MSLCGFHGIGNNKNLKFLSISNWFETKRIRFWTGSEFFCIRFFSLTNFTSTLNNFHLPNWASMWKVLLVPTSILVAPGKRATFNVITCILVKHVAKNSQIDVSVRQALKQFDTVCTDHSLLGGNVNCHAWLYTGVKLFQTWSIVLKEMQHTNSLFIQYKRFIVPLCNT